MKAKLLTIAGSLVFASAAVIAQTPATPAAAAKPAAPVATPAPVAAPAAAPAAPAAAPKAMNASSDALEGKAAWYGKKFAGRRTASGQRFNPAALTAAHGSLAFGTKVKVTNTKNNRSAVVVINDRYPGGGGRIIDVSRAAAVKLGFVRAGTADVKLEVVGTTKLKGAGHRGVKAKSAKKAKKAA